MVVSPSRLEGQDLAIQESRVFGATVEAPSMAGNGGRESTISEVGSAEDNSGCEIVGKFSKNKQGNAQMQRREEAYNERDQGLIKDKYELMVEKDDLLEAEDICHGGTVRISDLGDTSSHPTFETEAIYYDVTMQREGAVRRINLGDPSSFLSLNESRATKFSGGNVDIKQVARCCSLAMKRITAEKAGKELRERTTS